MIRAVIYVKFREGWKRGWKSLYGANFVTRPFPGDELEVNPGKDGGDFRLLKIVRISHEAMFEGKVTETRTRVFCKPCNRFWR